MGKRVAVGLSGGVDSAVAAALLLRQGYEVTGVYITCWSGPGCRSEEDRQVALDVALFLGIPFVHLDFQKEYRERVFEYMMAEYEAGRTPNPDVLCNREIKFGLFYDWALRQTQGKPSRFDFVATGHYAQIDNNSKLISQMSKRFCLKRSRDAKKDQTYFLFQLQQEQLEHILFPIGKMTKHEVRNMAQQLGLPNWDRPDSQGICFIGTVDVSQFLEKRIEKEEGNIVLRISNKEYRIANTHRGSWFYTIGQRITVDDVKTLQLAGFNTTKLPHFYVVEKDVAHNILYVGTRELGYRNTFSLEKMHWIGETMSVADLETREVYVRIRHGGELVNVKKIEIRDKTYEIRLDGKVWGVAPGQFCVFYDGDVVLGGGVICS